MSSKKGSFPGQFLKRFKVIVDVRDLSEKPRGSDGIPKHEADWLEPELLYDSFSRERTYNGTIQCFNGRFQLSIEYISGEGDEMKANKFYLPSAVVEAIYRHVTNIKSEQRSEAAQKAAQTRKENALVEVGE
tara:strand:+ start:313 stop:708 length:396 start_codon:yes stop_codon:yes gene_type:complete